LPTGHGVIVGEQLVLYDTVSYRVYIGIVLESGTNIIELDTPLNFTYPVASSALIRSIHGSNIDGSVTRQTLSVAPPSNELDITRIMFQMVTNDFCELDMFGDIPGGLERGIVFRKVSPSGETTNYFNCKTNGELALLMYDVKEYEAAKHGVNGLGGRLTYAGPSKHGVTLRLNPGESLEIIIQDDLRSLIAMHFIAAYHEVGN